MILNQEQAEQFLTVWKWALRLADWDIDIKIVRAKEMSLQPAGEAEITWVEEKKSARILLLDPIDYQSVLGREQDHERSIIHELMHLHMVGFDAPDGSPAGIAQEQMAHILASVILEIRDGRKKYE